MPTTFLVHHPADTVGVATSDIEAGQLVQGVVLETGEPFEVRAVDQIPLGHKIALRDLAAAEQVIKYGVSIGITREAVRAGQHVHTHNLKSVRWA